MLYEVITTGLPFTEQEQQGEITEIGFVNKIDVLMAH